MTDLTELLRPIEERLEKRKQWGENPTMGRAVLLDYVNCAPADIAKLLEAVKIMDHALSFYPSGDWAREARQKVREVLR